MNLNQTATLFADSYLVDIFQPDPAPLACAQVGRVDDSLHDGAILKAGTEGASVRDGVDPAAGHMVLNTKDIAIGVMHSIAPRRAPDMLRNLKRASWPFASARAMHILPLVPIDHAAQSAFLPVQIELMALAEVGLLCANGRSLHKPLRAVGEAQQRVGRIFGALIRLPLRRECRPVDEFAR